MRPIPQTIEAASEVSRYTGDTELLTTLQRVGDDVSALVPDCIGLSIAWTHHAVTFTLVASDEEIAVLDALQYLDYGPCLHAIAAGQGILTDHRDLMDEKAWQVFAAHTAAHGVRSTLTFPLTEHGHVVGSANLYGASDAAFDGHHEDLALILGAWAPGAVANADLAFATRAAAESSPKALRAEATIATALGLLMGRRQIDANTARAGLEDAARRAGITVEQLAAALIALRP